MMLNFEADLPQPATQESIGRTYVSREYLNKTEWEWGDLRDYVVYEIESRFGLFARDSIKESGIFKSFIKRWPNARQIAEFAFEVEGGKWKGREVSVFSFMKSEDDTFAAEIDRRLREST